MDDTNDRVLLGPELLAEAEAMGDDLIAWRREFHQFPELAFEENITASRVSQTLASFPGVEVVTGFGVPTAVLGVLRGDLPGPAVALRAEMDALALEEETGLSFASCILLVSVWMSDAIENGFFDCVCVGFSTTFFVCSVIILIKSCIGFCCFCP